MKKFVPLTIHERKTIESKLKQPISISEIAKQMHRGKNTIVAEVRVNGGREAYSAIQAQREHELKKEKGYEIVSEKLKTKHNKTEHPYVSIVKRVENLEMQIEILTDYIKEMKK